MKKQNIRLSRREALGAGAGLAFLPFANIQGQGNKSGSVSVAPDGGYATVPLAQETVRLGVVQTRIRFVDPENPEPIRQSNLQHMLDWIDRAQAQQRFDLLLFHELPLTGLSMSWDRDTVQRTCIEIPGPESDRIAAKAKEHGCHVVFGSYVREPDWPGHNLSITTIVGPDGEIVDKQWKARNVKGILDGGHIELMTTTIFNVLDEYVERYGQDRVIPVARTPIGNICTSSVQLEPELFRAFGIKGCEILLRTATGRYRMADVQGASLHNGYFSAMVNNAYKPDNIAMLERFFGPDDTVYQPDSKTVLSSIIGPDGSIVARATSSEEQIVSYDMPIAQLRASHRQPLVHQPLYDAVFDAYQPRYPQGLYSQKLPFTSEDAARYLSGKDRWGS